MGLIQRPTSCTPSIW